MVDGALRHFAIFGRAFENFVLLDCNEQLFNKTNNKSEGCVRERMVANEDKEERKSGRFEETES